MTRRAHHPGARLDDAGLLAGDLFDGMAEEIFVIEIDLRDHGDFRNDHVGGIQAAAHADFDHGEIDLLLARKNRRPWP